MMIRWKDAAAMGACLAVFITSLAAAEPTAAQEAGQMGVLQMLPPAEQPAWRPVNDTVMGGISRSEAHLHPDGYLIFRGEVSLENNGGFASIRTEPAAMDAEGAQAFRLIVRGDGHRYQLRFRTDNAWDGISYTASFPTSESEEWQAITIPVSDFRPTFRGRTIPQAPPLDPGKIRQVGLMISDKQEGRFELHVQEIAALTERAVAQEQSPEPGK